MIRYKNITSGTIEMLYDAVKQLHGLDTIEEAQQLVDEYVRGELDRDDLLADIDNELTWIPTEQDNLQNAIDNVIPSLSIPANAKAVLSGLASNQKRILQENLRQLKAWKFVIKNVVID